MTSAMKQVTKFRCVLAIAALSLVTSVAFTTAKTYCEICDNHTMCLYTDAAYKCPGYLSEGVTANDISLILKLHNYYRSLVAVGNGTRGLNGSVQPPAANMRRMIWDPELATIAQRWSNQCRWGHDQCRNVNRFQCGQNAYTGSRSRNVPAANWTAAIDAWFVEIDLFDGKKANSFLFDAATAHYTQMVWADTYLIGCGFTYFNETPWYTKMYFCNYGPAGNWMNEPLYLEGPPASKCPNDTVANSTDGLCWTTNTTTSASIKTVATNLPTPTKQKSSSTTAKVGKILPKLKNQ